MAVHSFHLAEIPATAAAKALARPPHGVAEHLECLSLMRLGAPAVTTERLQLGRLALFAQWRDESALDAFLDADPLGRKLADDWHVRLEFVRRWGAVSGLHQLPLNASQMDDDEPVVAVTLAYLKLPQLRRFFHWGRPVERLVREHPGQTLALAAVRPPRTFSTFSVWESLRQMRDMVEGRGVGDAPERHAAAMAERDRQDFHHEFTTLRFRALSEHGSWQGRTGIIPK